MNCCDEHGNCNQGRNCPVRRAAAEAQVTQPPLDPIPKPRDMHEPFNPLEKAFLVVIMLALFCICGGMIYTGAYYLLPGAFS